MTNAVVEVRAAVDDWCTTTIWIFAGRWNMSKSARDAVEGSRALDSCRPSVWAMPDAVAAAVAVDGARWAFAETGSVWFPMSVAAIGHDASSKCSAAGFAVDFAYCVGIDDAPTRTAATGWACVRIRDAVCVTDCPI